METAKVDIQKLQLLNDRISQLFDALNQVRFSVHGLSHSSQVPGIGQQGFGAQSPFAQQGFMGQGQFQNPYIGAVNPYVSPIGIGQAQSPAPWANPYAGLSHSTFGTQVPFGIAPQNVGQINPYLQQLGVMGPVTPQVPPTMGTAVPFGVNPLAAINPFLGLSHTSHELEYTRPLWADPLLAAKVAQTFPFIQLPISPVGV